MPKKIIGLITLTIIIVTIFISNNKQQNVPLAGKAGLTKLIERGIIRRANQDDMDKYYKQIDECLGGRRARISLDEKTYVVLKPMNYPLGLIGGNSALFIVGHGVPKPLGDPGQSDIFDMNISCKELLQKKRASYIEIPPQFRSSGGIDREIERLDRQIERFP